MAEGPRYYLVEEDESWYMKKEGGTDKIRTFACRTDAIAYAQVMISKQRANIRVQDRSGQWQTL